jgi:hypothetical protein
VGKKEPSKTAGGNISQYTSPSNHFGKQYGGFFKKFKMDLPYDPALPLLGDIPKGI